MMRYQRPRQRPEQAVQLQIIQNDHGKHMQYTIWNRVRITSIGGSRYFARYLDRRGSLLPLSLLFVFPKLSYNLVGRKNARFLCTLVKVSMCRRKKENDNYPSLSTYLANNNRQKDPKIQAFQEKDIRCQK